MSNTDGNFYQDFFTRSAGSRKVWQGYLLPLLGRPSANGSGVMPAEICGNHRCHKALKYVATYIYYGLTRMPDRLENHLSTWCHHAAHAFRMAFDAESRAWGLYGGEAVVLFKLKHYGSQSLAELSRRIGHSHPTVLAQVKNLEHAGYLSRSPHPEDRRVKIIELTASGEEIVSRFGRLTDEMNERVVAQFGMRETARVIADLKHLVKVLAVLAPLAKTDTEPRKVTNSVKHTHKRPRLSR